MKWKSLSCVQLFCNPMDYRVHGILQTRIMQQVAFPSPGDLPNPGIEPMSPALQVDSLPAEHKGSPYHGWCYVIWLNYIKRTQFYCCWDWSISGIRWGLPEASLVWLPINLSSCGFINSRALPDSVALFGLQNSNFLIISFFPYSLLGILYRRNFPF